MIRAEQRDQRRQMLEQYENGQSISDIARARGTKRQAVSQTVRRAHAEKYGAKPVVSLRHPQSKPEAMTHRIVELYRQPGMRLRDVAYQLNLTHYVVRHTLDDADEPNRCLECKEPIGHRRVTCPQCKQRRAGIAQQRIVELYRQPGRSRKQIAQELGISLFTVNRHLKSADEPNRCGNCKEPAGQYQRLCTPCLLAKEASRQSTGAAVQHRVVDLYRRPGTSRLQIARDLNISSHTVYRALQDAGEPNRCLECKEPAGRQRKYCLQCANPGTHPRPKRNAALQQKVVELYRQPGHSRQRIAKQLDVSLPSVHQALKDAGEPNRCAECKQPAGRYRQLCPECQAQRKQQR